MDTIEYATFRYDTVEVENNFDFAYLNLSLADLNNQILKQ